MQNQPMNPDMVSGLTHAKAAIRRPVAVLCLVTPLWLLAQTAFLQRDWHGVAEAEDAIIAPLASKSLLQDVVRSGERLVAVGERGHILISSDAGASWTQVPNVPTRSMLISVTAAGDRLWAVGHDTVILISEDRGDTWRKVAEDPGGHPLLEIMFDDQGNGIAVGAYSLRMRSSDWGESWTEDYLVDLLVNEEETAPDAEDSLNEMGLIDQEAMAAFEDEGIQYHLNGLFRVNDAIQLVAAEAGRYYISADNGASWQQLRLDYEGSLFGVTAMQHGACLVMYGLRGHVFRNCTLDADSLDLTSWQEIRTATNAGLFAAAADSTGRLWLVGANGAILSLDMAGNVADFTVDQGDDFTAVMPLSDGLLLLGESGTQLKPFSSLRSD